MPAQECIGLDDQQGRSLAWQLAGQENKEGPVTPGEGRAFPLPLQDDELLTQQGVFQYQFRFAAGEIQGHTYGQGIAAFVGTCPLTQALRGPVIERLYPALDETKEHESHGLPFEEEYGDHDPTTKLPSLPNPARASSIQVDSPQGLLVLISGSFDGWGFSARTSRGAYSCEKHI